MDDPTTAPPREKAPQLFAELIHSPHQHFTLYFYAAVLRVLDQASTHFGSAEAVNEKLPFAVMHAYNARR